MDVKVRWHAHKSIGNFREAPGGEAGIDFKGGIVFAVVVARPVFGQLAKLGNFGELAGLALLFCEFFLDGLGDGLGVNPDMLRIYLPKRRMVFDARVEERLGDGGIVHFAVAMAAVADDVDHDIGIKLGPVFGGEPADTHDGIGIFGVDVENGDALAAGDAGSVPRRVLLRGARGETDQIIDDDVQSAADRISREVRKIQRFRPNALAGEGRVAVHHDGPDFVERFSGAIDLRTADTVARQFCARAAHGDGVDRFEVAGVRDKVNVERFSGGCCVNASRANVIFDVAGAKHAAGIYVLKARDNL